MWNTLYELKQTSEGSFWQRVKQFFEGKISYPFKKSLKKALKNNLPEFAEPQSPEEEKSIQIFKDSCDKSIEEFTDLASDVVNSYFDKKLLIGSTDKSGIMSIPGLKKDDFVFVTPLTRPYNTRFGNYLSQITSEQRRVGIAGVHVKDGYIQIITDKTGDITIMEGYEPRHFNMKFLSFCFVQVAVIPLSKERLD